MSLSKILGMILLFGLVFAVLLSLVLLSVQWIRYSNATPTPVKKAVLVIDGTQQGEAVLVNTRENNAATRPENSQVFYAGDEETAAQVSPATVSVVVAAAPGIS